jgi:hypothetical protein
MKAGKEGPMKKNFGISPVRQDFEGFDYLPVDPPTRRDSVRAINMRNEWRMDGKPEQQIDREYSQIPDAKKSRKILNQTDRITKDKNKTEEVLVKAVRKSDAKRRTADLKKKAVKSTTKNTVGILKDSKNKNKKTTFNTSLNI